MYSLVAIGFVLIYKASGVLNFAQGAMVLFAALTFVSLVERGMPLLARARRSRSRSWCVLGIAIERTVLRPLVNQPPITLFMATLGLSYVLEGLAQLLWGTQVHGLDLGIPDVPIDGCRRRRHHHQPVRPVRRRRSPACWSRVLAVFFH